MTDYKRPTCGSLCRPMALILLAIYGPREIKLEDYSWAFNLCIYNTIWYSEIILNPICAVDIKI